MPGNSLALNLLPCFFHKMWVISGPSDLTWSHAHPCCITSESLLILFLVFIAGLVKIPYLPRNSHFLIHWYVGISVTSFVFFFQILFYCRLRSFRSFSFTLTALEVQQDWSSKQQQRVPGARRSLAAPIEMTQGTDPSCHQRCCQCGWPYAAHEGVPTDNNSECRVKCGA